MSVFRLRLFLFISTDVLGSMLNYGFKTFLRKFMKEEEEVEVKKVENELAIK